MNINLLFGVKHQNDKESKFTKKYSASKFNTKYFSNILTLLPLSVETLNRKPLC